VVNGVAREILATIFTPPPQHQNNITFFTMEKTLYVRYALEIKGMVDCQDQCLSNELWSQDEQ
jgi:hypothetical protein